MDNIVSNVLKGQKKNKFKASSKPAQNNPQVLGAAATQPQGQQAQQAKPQTAKI